MTSKQATEEVKDLKKELQSNSLVPSIAQFVSLYRFVFKLPEIEIEELEDGLLEANEVGGKTLQELLLALVKSAYPSRGISDSNLEEHLQRLLKRFWRENKSAVEPLPEGKTFSQLDVATKVEFLHFLCCLRVDRPDAETAMKNMDADALRVQPLGNDDDGNEYWYFFGTRLYKQEPAKQKKKDWEEEWNHQKEESFNRRTRGRGRPRKVKQQRKSDGESDDFEDVSQGGRYMNIDEKSRWSVVCNTIEDWVDFAEKLKSSKSKNEKALFQTITDNFLPVLNEIYQEKERRLQQKLRELVPKRIITRRETRQQKVKNLQKENGYDPDTAHREHLARDRAKRLEERNRRLDESTERSKSRSRRSRYMDDDEEDEDDYEDEDYYQEIHVESTPQPVKTHDYRKEYVPLIAEKSSDLKTQMLNILSEVKLQKDAYHFLYPVDEAMAPAYYDIISNPMDLETMSQKLLNGEYLTIGHIDQDFKQMVDNCKLYNGEKSPLTNMVMNLWRVFRRGASKLEAPPPQAQAPPPPNQTPPPLTQCPRTEPQIVHLTRLQKEDKTDDYTMKRPSDSVDGRKKKKKKTIKDMDALEVMSQQAKKAVEKPSSLNTELQQPRQMSLYSDLKIVPIHSNPATIVERYSDSSNNEMDDLDSSSASASSYLDLEEPRLFQKKQATHSEKEPYFAQSEDSSDLHDMEGKGFNILSDGDGLNHMLSDTEGVDLPRSGSQDGATKDCNVEGLMSGLPREAMFLTEGQRVSPAYSRKTPPNAFAVPVRNPEGHLTTIDASALNMSSFGQSAPVVENFQNFAKLPQSSPKAKPRYSPTVQQATQDFQGLLSYQQTQKPTIADPQTSTFQSNGPQQSKVFQTQNQNQVFLQPSLDQNKMPAMKLALPPSAGELLVVPNESTNPGMTFHLYAKPHSNPSQPIQQQWQVFPDGTMQMIGQNNQATPSNTRSQAPTIIKATPCKDSSRPKEDQPPKRKSSPPQSDPLPNPAEPITTMPYQLQSTTRPNLTKLQQAAPFSSSGTSLVRPNAIRHHNPFTEVSSSGNLFLQNSPNSFQNVPPTTLPMSSSGNLQMSSSSSLPMSSATYLPPTTLSMPPASLPMSSSSLSMSSATHLPPPTSFQMSSSSHLPPSTTFQVSSSAHLPPSAIYSMSSSGQLPPSTTFSMSSMTQLPPTTSGMPQIYQTMSPSAAAFPSYSYRQASVNTATMTTSSTQSAKAPRLSLQKVYIPNTQQSAEGLQKIYIPNTQQLGQNGTGQQFVLWTPSSKDAAKRAPNAEPMGQEVLRTAPETITSANFLPSANNVFALQTAPGNPSQQVYAQVLPNQLPQYINQGGTPYYIVADPSSLQQQNPQRYPLMNMQPVPFPNR